MWKGSKSSLLESFMRLAAVQGSLPHRDRRKYETRPAYRRTVRTGGNSVIRQAISCDICAAEKKQTNHWFVAYEQDGELRVSGWSSRKRLRPGAKHLCGQTCLHKLMDDFMARTLAARLPQAAADDAASEAQKYGAETGFGH
jgi:hypothetical protein